MSSNSSALNRSNSQNVSSKAILSWEEYGKLIEQLIYQIKESGVHYDYVYGIPRGGLIPAVFISNVLDIPMFDPNPVYGTAYQKNLLIVDDISDTGTSIRQSIKSLEVFEWAFLDTATIYKHVKTSVIPRYWIAETDRWVEFPYEKRSI